MSKYMAVLDPSYFCFGVTDRSMGRTILQASGTCRCCCTKRSEPRGACTPDMALRCRGGNVSFMPPTGRASATAVGTGACHKQMLQVSVEAPL